MDDDELVAVSISCTLHGFIAVGSPTSRIGLYSSADKAEEFHSWLCWSDCRAGCRPMSEWIGKVYAEGRAASTSLADVTLIASCGPCDEPGCGEEAKLTVVKIDRLYWDEHELAPQNTPLDWCENNDGRRIFPDLLFPGDGQGALRRKVDLVAEVKPALKDVNIFFKVWDVDDPFDQLNAAMPNVGVIDNNASGRDNRPSGEAPVLLLPKPTNASGIARVPFTVSMQPGNNYRAAAAFSAGALNQNTIKNGQTLDPQQQADALNAKFPSSPGSWEGYELPVTWSEMLTVWRKLHVEMDTMGPVIENEIITWFTDISGTGTALTAAKGINSINDLSHDLDTDPSGNGRFENGTFTVGTAPSTITISPILANGHTRVEFASASIAGLPFTAVNDDSFGNGIIGGTIADVTRGGGNFIWSLTITSQNENPIDWPDFVGGTLEVGGGAKVPIVGASATAPQLRTSALNIPCRIHDDDDDTLLPRLPDVSEVAAAYAPAYVVPAYDVGDDSLSVPLVLNIQNPTDLVDAQDWDSWDLNAPNFWVAYVLNAFQPQAWDPLLQRGDADEDAESSEFGVTARPSGGSLIYLEVHQPHEGQSNPQFQERVTVVHELGHAVGDSGDHPVTGNNDADATYVADYLLHIRKASKPRG